MSTAAKKLMAGIGGTYDEAKHKRDASGKFSSTDSAGAKKAQDAHAHQGKHVTLYKAVHGEAAAKLAKARDEGVPVKAKVGERTSFKESRDAAHEEAKKTGGVVIRQTVPRASIIGSHRAGNAKPGNVDVATHGGLHVDHRDIETPKEDKKPEAVHIDPDMAAKLPPQHSLEEHIAIARHEIDRHNAGFDAELKRLVSLAPKGAEVFGRVKTVKSTVEKVARKPKYGNAKKMQDLTGMSIDAANSQDVKHAIDGIRKNYTVVSEDDYHAKPTDEGYRAHHFIVKGPDGLEKEIQIHTARAAAWKGWYHEVYKPETPKQKEWMAVPTNKDALRKFATALSQHFADLDDGKRSTRPTPPREMHGAPFKPAPTDDFAAAYRHSAGH